MFEDETKPIGWLPTVGFFLFLGIVAWMFFAPGDIFNDPGVGRHLRTAEFILETGQVPHTDPLSFTRAGESWTDFEWAFEATLGQLYRFGGLGLICAFCYTIFAATVLNVFRMLVQSHFSTSVVMLYTGIAFLTLHLHFSARPVLFTYLFMAVVIEVWHRRTYPLRRDWAFLPIIFAAWANIHAGWLAGLVFWGGAIVGRAMDLIFKRVKGEDAPLIPWIGLLLLCLLATSLNPWGWHLHRQIILFATSYKSFALWDEYLPPNFMGPSMSAITVMFILIVVLLTRLRRNAPKWRWEAALPIGFFLFEGLKAQRHVILLAEVAAIPIGRDLEVLLHGTWWPWMRETLRNFQANQRLAFGDAWLALAASLVLTVFFLQTPDAKSIEVGKGVTPHLIAFLRDHPDRFHRPLTTTRVAGPLLWNMRPEFRVSFDDRGDFYGDKSVFAFVAMSQGAPGWRETFDQGNYDSALLEPYMSLNGLIRTLPGWKEVYRDKNTVVYWKDATATP